MKKLTCILLCMLLALSAASALGEEAVDYSEHETFTYWLYATPNDYYASYSDNPVTQYLNYKFNVTIEFEQPATGTEADSLSLMFGTGEYTDAIDMAYYTGSISELYEDGVIVNIADYLDYMPNLSKLLEENDDYRKTCYDDYGCILSLRGISAEDEVRWGGLVYRKDILETMTGGYIFFPSGNDEPTTIEDWEYMLPLFKAYFEAAGMPDYAALIIPYTGYFPMGELASGFGVDTNFYLDGDTVKFGPMEEGFYNYLVKMHEWYEAGYIYQDFASRTNDLFYLPNTNLTYGAAAGAWFGLASQIGDTMSIPDYGLYYDVHAAASPLDTEHGITEAFPFSWVPSYDPGTTGVVITTACKDIPKLLSILDYLYGDEGGMMRQNGLTAAQAAEANIELYFDNGLDDGVYWITDDGEFVFNPLLTAGGGTMDAEPFISVRYPTLSINTYMNQTVREEELEASAIWARYHDSDTIGRMPGSLSYPVDESKTLADNTTVIFEYIDTMVPKFIMGTEPLTEESWNAYVAQLKAYGIEESLQIEQDAYDRYLER